MIKYESNNNNNNNPLSCTLQISKRPFQNIKFKYISTNENEKIILKKRMNMTESQSKI
jgi:hypothetical protein